MNDRAHFRNTRWLIHFWTTFPQPAPNKVEMIYCYNLPLLPTCIKSTEKIHLSLQIVCCATNTS
jgi:hypothetical protein